MGGFVTSQAPTSWITDWKPGWVPAEKSAVPPWEPSRAQTRAIHRSGLGPMINTAGIRGTTLTETGAINSAGTRLMPNLWCMLELTVLNRGRAPETKDNKRSYPTNKGKTRWEQTTVRGRRQRRSVKCTYSNRGRERTRGKIERE